MLLQSFGRELLVLDYALNKARITELYCVNKARPSLHCNGKCYLAQKLRKAERPESKSPAAAYAKVKLDVILPLSWQLPSRPAPRAATLPYGRTDSPGCPPGFLRGTFQPPAFRV